jgi:V/A-type H+-transporting ATPase subunit I
LKNISWIIFYCGCWAILFGALYGEFFGGDQFFGINLEPIDLWLPGIGWITVHQPLNNVLGLLWLVIFIGIVHINLGMVIEFSNFIMERKIYQAVADPLMKILFLDFLVYLVLYWGLDIMVWLSPPYPILLPIIPGLLLIILKPLGKLFGISYMEGESYSELLSEGSIETFETMLSIPSNILSYLRLLALALAHISLMLAIERIAQLLTGENILTQILIVVVLIFGNTIIIVLEGIIAFINALRLNFYEFFFKFYEGVGTEFDPFTLKNEFSKIEFKPETEKDVISPEIEKEIETKKAKEFVDEAKSYIEKKYLK